MSIEKLNSFLLSDIPEVVNTTKRAQLLIDKRLANQISNDEFDELMADLTNIDNINRSMISLEAYRELAELVSTIISIKSTISLF
ncbi:MAG: hypothetical protein ACXW2E_00480 [Nitrososphaeraceae archaeon]